MTERAKSIIVYLGLACIAWAGYEVAIHTTWAGLGILTFIALILALLFYNELLDVFHEAVEVAACAYIAIICIAWVVAIAIPVIRILRGEAVRSALSGLIR